MGLEKGKKAPDFNLYDTDRKSRSLSEFHGKNVVLAFYPGAFTGVCTKEMCALQDSMSKLNDLNAQVVGISVDSPFSNKGFAAQNKLQFPLLSDFSREVSKKYAGVYQDFAGVKGYTASKRAVYIIDPEGKIKYVWITEDPGVEPDYKEISDSLK